MGRKWIASLAGIFGFIAYVMLVVALGDAVITLHWLVQLAYFLLAGTLWTWPARRLMVWAARG